jgi:hypothetical protein
VSKRPSESIEDEIAHLRGLDPSGLRARWRSVKAAIEGRLPRGIGVEQLRELPLDWSRQFETLGLGPA